MISVKDLWRGHYYLYYDGKYRYILKLTQWNPNTLKEYPFRFKDLSKTKDNIIWFQYSSLKYMIEITKDRAFLEIL
jgi:hypothetical protein